MEIEYGPITDFPEMLNGQEKRENWKFWGTLPVSSNWG
jgi:hypothetical protein